MDSITIVVMGLGAAIVAAGIALIVARRSDAGATAFRFMGVEFNASGGTGYMVFVIGVIVFLTPIFKPVPSVGQRPEPKLTAPSNAPISQPPASNSTSQSAPET